MGERPVNELFIDMVITPAAAHRIKAKYYAASHNRTDSKICKEDIALRHYLALETKYLTKIPSAHQSTRRSCR